MIRTSTILFLTIMMLSVNGHASETHACDYNDTSCLMTVTEASIEQITEKRWRNHAYRDLAVSLAYSGDIDKAVTLISKIDNPDTQAMTVRAIGMALANNKDLSDEAYKDVFSKLDNSSKTITHEGARDIAYTYIAMAQAFAGLDNDAMQTTLNMTKPELKNKALGETAEIQAERGDYDEAIRSINAIQSQSFKNKALGLVNDIFVKDEQFDLAYQTAIQITNATRKAKSLQNIIDAQIGLDQK
jgi:predicted negative regulator of RcsB-dependent stress response